jgi:regulator of nucleoside diphosphate kinase
MEKLDALIGSAAFVLQHDRKRLKMLREELAAAEVLDNTKVPNSVVAMNSYVDITDLDTGRNHKYQVVFPQDADHCRNRISVLSLLGTALLGHGIGAEVECPVLGGVRRFRIDQVRCGISNIEVRAKSA